MVLSAAGLKLPYASTGQAAHSPVTPVVACSRRMLKGKEHLAYWTEHLAVPQCVYVIGAGAGKPVKIGFARDVEARISSLQTGHWERLVLFHVVPGGSDIEHRLHALFEDSRVRRGGEWFGYLPEELVRIHLWVGGLANACVEVHDGSRDAPEVGHRWTPFMRSAAQRPSATDRFDPVPVPLQPVGRRG